ncbi:MAG: hypothetical protein ACRENO_08625 [Thermodesulfobacteriota bacterium]
MKYTRIIAPFLLLFLSLTLDSSSQEDLKSEVEILKKQIEQIQKTNQEMIEKIQRDSSEQINKLREKVEQLEVDKSVEKEVIGETDEKSLKEKVKDVILDIKSEEKFESINITFSKDFPSYFRTRGRFIDGATFLGATDADDEVFFVDSRLLLSPRINVGEFLSVRSQLDIFSNGIWGGFGDELISDTTFEAPSPGDSFRGAVLRDVTNTLSGSVVSPTENVDLVDIRSLYAVGRVPFGEFWIGRQPFDWGLGIFNNAGSLPDQDLGSIVDRFEFDTAPFSLIDKKWENLLFAFIADRLSEGQGIGTFDEGDGWDLGLATFYEDEKLTLGAYIFLIYQNNFDLGGGLTADLDPAVNWSLYASYLYQNNLKFSFEFQNLIGQISDIGEPVSSFLGDDEIDIGAENISLVARAEYYPHLNIIDLLAFEFGWSNGDDAATPDKLEGNNIYFNNAFTVDNLLFKHVVPGVYALEGSVINSFYVRGWSTFKLLDSVFLTPQVLVAWNDETNALAADLFTPLPEVNRYLGTELETTLTFKLREHFWFDLIGSVIVPGDGLDDLLTQRAFIEGALPSLDDGNNSDLPFAIQARFIITLDSLIGKWTGSSSTLRRAWFE